MLHIKTVPALQYCSQAFSLNGLLQLDTSQVKIRSMKTVKSFLAFPSLSSRLRWPLVKVGEPLLTLVNYPESHCDQRRTHGPRTRDRGPSPMDYRHSAPLRPASSLDCVGRRGPQWRLAMGSTRLSVDLTGPPMSRLGNSSV
jgi:hypothetical protein